MMRLQDKRAVVTGGASGIGSATATFFARQGARVVIADIDRQKGEDVVRAIRDADGTADFIQADVTEEEAVTEFVTRVDELLGGIDVWMNNAGASLTEGILEIEPDEWKADLSLNLTSHFLCTRRVLPVMIRCGGGSLINISSVNGLWAMGEFSYSSAKAGLISFTKNVAVNYGPQGIRANVICPGTIETERVSAYWDQKTGAREKLVKWYPVGRLGQPEDVAHMAVFLASDESSFITGSTMVVDGGLLAGNRLFGNM
jgi:meso-butanediol dehydrogenase / (S,S)-butanediol dehydrogenase / diacetyl reductase